MGTVLVFPAAMPAAAAFARQARARGERVVAATSVVLEEREPAFDAVVTVPFLHDVGFAEALAEVVRTHGVRKFFTPHVAAHEVVRQLIDRDALPLEIAGGSPLDTMHEEYRNVLDVAGRYLPFAAQVAEGVPPLSKHEFAALLLHALRIYGQSNEAKIAALAGIFPKLPEGDVIEIGVAWGRSAYVLTTLARRFDTGRVLAMDPWECEAAQQYDSPERLLEFNRILDWDQMFDIFRMNLIPYGYGHFNYRRGGAETFASDYHSGMTVRTPEFGETRYRGRIALLHIDGNHDYACVARDYELWSNALASGGWVVFDDYVWEHGDGPRVYADRLLSERREDFDRAFVTGSALFLRKK